MKSCFKREISDVQKKLFSWWTRAATAEKRTDFVQHICREHNQEAHQMANNLGAAGVEKVATDEKITRKWKAIGSWWDGSAKSDGRIKCGTVIKGVV